MTERHYNGNQKPLLPPKVDDAVMALLGWSIVVVLGATLGVVVIGQRLNKIAKELWGEEAEDGQG